MKVLYLANGLPHYFNLVLSKLNSVSGMEVVVVVPKGPGRHIGDGVFQSKIGVGFRVVEMEECKLGGLIDSFRGLSGLLYRERPDVVVFPEYLLKGFFLHPGVALARLRIGAKLVMKSIPFQMPDYPTLLASLSASGADSRSWYSRCLGLLGVNWLRRRAGLELRRVLFRSVDAHVNYVEAGREVFGSYGVASQRIFVTRNSPDTDEMRRAEMTLLGSDDSPVRGRWRILHVGRLVSQKRLDLLLDAFPAVREKFPHAELVVVGDGPERVPFEARAVALGISEAVRFVGAVYDPLELGRQFLSASIFVLPGLGGLSINEAMFYGLAVVCSSGDGTEQFLVREGYNGTFFRQGDSSSLAAAILRLLADQDELVRMGARSRDIIDREVNIGTVVEGYLRAFRYVCQ